MLLQRLKIETRPHHDRIESVVGLAWTAEEYRKQLEYFYGFLQPWEQRIHAVQRLLPDFPARLLEPRRKVPLLEHDLLFWGGAIEAIKSLPKCTNLPSLRSLPELLGSLYVFEGATLGGQVISRHLEQTLGLSNGEGYRFFRGYGPETARMWKHFGACLEASSSPAEEEAIIQSACETFEKLHDWFCIRK